MQLKHVVVTSVDRDDVPDKGAAHYAATIRAIKSKLPNASVEVLTPDFLGVEERGAAHGDRRETRSLQPQHPRPCDGLHRQMRGGKASITTRRSGFSAVRKSSPTTTC
jgi:hypothetical protein